MQQFKEKGTYFQSTVSIGQLESKSHKWEEYIQYGHNVQVKNTSVEITL